MGVIDVLRQRHSVRAFLERTPTRELVTELLQAAARAPSGANTQPWQVEVVSGDTLARLKSALLERAQAGERPRPEVPYYPEEWFEPYTSRRNAAGAALYAARGIARDDRDARRDAWHDNYRLFGAPVALLFYIDRRLGPYSWLDLGAFIQSLMLAAQEQGLATCPQAALADYPDAVDEVLSRDSDRLLVAGMALGYADEGAAVNQYRTERAAIEQFVHWHE